ncbi:hypothetical protein EVAR_12893_1 [Eumeta japonica]|uniref:Uncharacterized protein n=1 Tax=Eumeta variegata TaxID=151549 RepID=A0A4C1TW53_EUMVA|nr:hypothetical protein EVAR_12893_1 [Eumeta japonica]
MHINLESLRPRSAAEVGERATPIAPQYSQLVHPLSESLYDLGPVPPTVTAECKFNKRTRGGRRPAVGARAQYSGGRVGRDVVAVRRSCRLRGFSRLSHQTDSVCSKRTPQLSPIGALGGRLATTFPGRTRSTRPRRPYDIDKKKYPLVRL